MLIAFAAKAGSGKTYAAEYLMDRYGFMRVKFADPLKAMLRAIGLTYDHIEGTLKEIPCDLLCGKTPRHAMQTLGTEWGRQQIDPNLWLGLFRNSVRKHLGRQLSVVCDDVRFPNEAELIRKLGGKVVGIEALTASQLSHVSESFPFTPDLVLHNDFSNNFTLALDGLVSSYGRITR